MNLNFYLWGWVPILRLPLLSEQPMFALVPPFLAKDLPISYESQFLFLIRAGATAGATLQCVGTGGRPSAWHRSVSRTSSRGLISNQSIASKMKLLLSLNHQLSPSRASKRSRGLWSRSQLSVLPEVQSEWPCRLGEYWRLHWNNRLIRIMVVPDRFLPNATGLIRELSS